MNENCANAIGGHKGRRNARSNRERKASSEGRGRRIGTRNSLKQRKNDHTEGMDQRREKKKNEIDQKWD